MIASSTFGMFSVSPVPRLTSDKYFKINFVDSVFPAPDSPLQKIKSVEMSVTKYNTVEPPPTLWSPHHYGSFYNFVQQNFIKRIETSC